MTSLSSRLPEVALTEFVQVYNNDLDHLALTSFSRTGLGLASGGVSGQPQFHLIAPRQPGKALGVIRSPWGPNEVVATKAPAREGAG